MNLHQKKNRGNQGSSIMIRTSWGEGATKSAKKTLAKEGKKYEWKKSSETGAGRTKPGAPQGAEGARGEGAARCTKNQPEHHLWEKGGWYKIGKENTARNSDEKSQRRQEKELKKFRPARCTGKAHQERQER